MPSITPYLIAHLRAHPSMQPQDVAKLCYQAANGAEHLLADLDRARAYFAREWEQTPPDHTLSLAEPISDGIARVHIAAWRAKGLSLDELFDLFAATAQADAPQGSLSAYLDEAEALILGGSTPISPDDWKVFRARYEAAGMPPVHHSEAFRQAERPAYRIVLRILLPIGEIS